MNHMIRNNLDLLHSLVNSRKQSVETQRAISARTVLVNRHIALYRKFTFSQYCQNMADSIQTEFDKIMRGA